MTSRLEILRPALVLVRGCVNALSILLLCLIVALIFLQILGRYVFNYSISWSEEAAIFAQVWLVMLGAGIAMRDRNHVGIDILIERCPLRVQQLAKATSFLLGAWFLLVVIVGSFSLIGLGMILKSTALQLPLAVPYTAMPVGMAYFLLEFTLATVPDVLHPGRATRRPGLEAE